MHPSQGTDTQDVKAPHEEGSGGYKVIRKGPSLEERFEVDFEGREGDCFRRQKSRFLLWRNGDGKARCVQGLADQAPGSVYVYMCMCINVCGGGSIFRGVRSVCGGLGIHLTLLGIQETFPSWEDQKVSLFSTELNQEELR